MPPVRILEHGSVEVYGSADLFVLCAGFVYSSNSSQIERPLLQIQCHRCRVPLLINHPGSQFQCPHCGAVNVVVVPQGGAPRDGQIAVGKKNMRKVAVLGSFVGLGLLALVLGWWGAVLGGALLAWSIAGGLGKVRGPVELVLPQTRRLVFVSLGVGLGSFVTTCGVLGGVSRQDMAEKKIREAKEAAEREDAAAMAEQKRVAEEATAKASHDAALRANLSTAVSAYVTALNEAQALIDSGDWAKAKTKLDAAVVAVADYRTLDPVPAEITALTPRYDELRDTLDLHRRETEVQAWITRAEGVVGDKNKCQNTEEVEAANRQVEGLRESDAGYAEVQTLSGKLDRCAADMPPPSEWRYAVVDDPMGGQVGVAKVQSSNAFEFDFPYRGLQHATLTVRDDKGTSVYVAVERGQFVCFMGCSVMVRFDDGKPQRWRAVGPSDHSTDTLFLRSEAKFLKQLKKARTVRFEAAFYQEGMRVLEFPVARFDAGQFM